MPPPVLLVEDNEKDALLFQHTLRTAGIPNLVFVADTVEAAIAHLSGQAPFSDRESYPVPAAVFIDLVLPGQSGHELLAWLQQTDGFRDLIRVVLTGSEDPGDVKRALALGAHAYLRKPLTVQQLINPIMNLQSFLARHPALA